MEYANGHLDASRRIYPHVHGTRCIFFVVFCPDHGRQPLGNLSILRMIPLYRFSRFVIPKHKLQLIIIRVRLSNAVSCTLCLSVRIAGVR